MTISKLIDLYETGKYKTVYNHCENNWNGIPMICGEK